MKSIVPDGSARKNVIPILIKFNLGWYREVMRDLLLRYKILMIFLAAMLAPTLKSLCYFIAIPMRDVFDPLTDNKSVTASLLIFQLLGLVWIMLYQRVASNRSWESYFSSLNISQFENCIIDICVIMLINIIIWIPALLSGVQVVFSSNFSLIQFVLMLVKFFLLISLVLLMQITYLKKKYKLFLSVLVIDVFFILSRYLFLPMIQIFFILILMLFSLYLIYLSYQKNRKNVHAKNISLYLKKEKNIFRGLFPLLRIQLKILKSDISQISMIFLLLLVMTVLSVCLLIYGRANPQFLLILSIIMLINALGISNLFKIAQFHWAQISCYLSSLPISSVVVFVINFTISTCVALIINLLIFGIAVLSGAKVINMSSVIAILMPIVFLLFSYVPQVKFERYGVFASSVLMLLFLYLNFLLIYIPE